MRRHILVITLVLALASGAVPFSIGSARASGTHGYVVVFAGQPAADGTFDLTVSHEAILSLVASAGGTIIADLSAQIGVLVVESANPLFAAVLRGSVLVEGVGQDFGWKAVPTYDEAVASGAPVNVDAGGGGPEQTEDPLESQQWSMMQIRAPEGHAIHAGWRGREGGRVHDRVVGG